VDAVELPGHACHRHDCGVIGRYERATQACRKDTLKGELVYRDPGANGYDAQQRKRTLRTIRQRAEAFDFALVNRQTGELLETVVS